VETAVNVNTAPAEVISALVDGLSLSDAQSLVNTRNRGAYYRNKTDFTTQQQVVGHPITASWDVKSNYFLAYSRVKLDRATLETQALLYRPNTIPNTSVLWIREY
jgi:general secretion pathway protein K